MARSEDRVDVASSILRLGVVLYVENQNRCCKPGFLSHFAERIDEDLRDIHRNDSPTQTIQHARTAGIVTIPTLWEFQHLDEDGGTTGLQQKLNAGKDVLNIEYQGVPDQEFWVREYSPILAKYAHLAPHEYLTILPKSVRGRNMQQDYTEFYKQNKHYFVPFSSPDPDFLTLPGVWRKPSEDTEPPRPSSTAPPTKLSEQEEPRTAKNEKPMRVGRDPELE